VTTDDALALIRTELRRLAWLISELADRIEALERGEHKE
jgi:hypothetical protein